MADHDQDERPVDEGTFRWPSSGLPRVLGQPSGERAGEPPAPPRISLSPQPPYPVPPWGQGVPGDQGGPADGGGHDGPGGYSGAGWAGGPGGRDGAGGTPAAGLAAAPGPDVHPLASLLGLADEYDAVDDYDSAHAYGPPGGWASATDAPAPAGHAADAEAGAADEAAGGEAAGGEAAGGEAAAGEAAADESAGDAGAADEAHADEGPAGRFSPASWPGSPSAWVPVAPPLNLPPPDPEPPGETADSLSADSLSADSLTADSLTADLLLPGRHPVPADGWRLLLHRSTGGLIRIPQSAAARHRQELELRACTPVAAGHYRVAVLSLKGGVGKTTTVMGLGATLASLRGDRVIAVDANPDRGTLSDKLRLETAATVRDLLNERGQVARYADVRAYTTQAPSRLEVLASDRDPTVSVAFGEQDYLDVAHVLAQYYSVCITDCGTGLLHSAMAGVLQLADQVILVSSPSVDGARSASATLDWLTAHGYGHLVRSAVVVLSAVRPLGKSTVDLARLEQHFAARCRAVQRVPYDDHLAEGAEVDLARFGRATADAYLALAAVIGDGFAGQIRPAWRPGAR